MDKNVVPNSDLKDEKQGLNDKKMPDLVDYIAYAVFGGLIAIFLFPAISPHVSNFIVLGQNDYFVVGAIIGILIGLRRR